MLEWKPISNYEDLPVGMFLVKVKGNHDPYHVAYVSLNNINQKFVVVGGRFHFDMGEIVAYAEFNKTDLE